LIKNLKSTPNLRTADKIKKSRVLLVSSNNDPPEGTFGSVNDPLLSKIPLAGKGWLERLCPVESESHSTGVINNPV
jgi:hypothetical protein